jgi:hypothetical protein
LFNHHTSFFHFTDMLGQTRSERCHEVAVSGGRAQRGGQTANELESDPN